MAPTAAADTRPSRRRAPCGLLSVRQVRLVGPRSAAGDRRSEATRTRPIWPRLGALATAPFHTSLLVACTAALVSACPGIPAPENAITDGREMLSLFGAIRSKARNLRAEGRADHLGPEGRVRGTVMFFVEREARLRFDALTPASTTAATLTTDGDRFTLLDAAQRRFFTGPAEACNVSRLLRIPLDPRDIVEILLGGTPLVGPAAAARVRWSEEGYYVLTLRSPDGARTQEVHVSGDRGKLDLLSSVVRDGRGIWFAIEYEDYRRVGGVRIPETIHFEMPRQDADVRLRYDDVEVNVEIPEDAFRQTVPEGMRAEEVTCP